MKIRLYRAEKKSRTSIAISIAVHVVVIAALATITFKIPEIFYPAPVPIEPVTIRYVPVKPAPSAPAQAGGGGAQRSRRQLETTVLAPTSIPAAPPVAAPPAAVPSTDVKVGNANRRADGGAGVGVTVGIPDSRIALDPGNVGRLPLSAAQRADSALSAIYEQYLDSVRVLQANPGRAPGDWSWGGKNGDKWGWDQNGIHIGGITIPNAVLAALPLNMGPSGSNMNAVTEQRTNSYIEQDIARHANAMTKDEFNDRVHAIRERMDRERQEKLAKQRKPPE